jgi:hypothetical protein
VQGELMGPGVQGNREGLTVPQLFVYYIFDIDTQQYLLPSEKREVIAALTVLGFNGDKVPVVSDDIPLPSSNVADLLKFADGPSLKNPVREGLVWKSNVTDFSFKTISNQFLLKNDG